VATSVIDHRAGDRRGHGAIRATKFEDIVQVGGYGYGYAIPINTALEVVNELLAGNRSGSAVGTGCLAGGEDLISVDAGADPSASSVDLASVCRNRPAARLAAGTIHYVTRQFQRDTEV